MVGAGAGYATILGEGGDLVGEPFGVDDMRIEVVGDPLLEFGVAFVLRVGDRSRRSP